MTRSQEDMPEDMPEDLPKDPEVARLIHDLQVHQHELEMQNRELREAQGLLEESRSRYSDLYDLAPIAYVILDARGRILEANLTAAALFGLEHERVVGQLISTLVPRPDRTRLMAHLRQCLTERRRVSVDLYVRDRQKRSIAVQLTSMPILSSGGTATGCRTALTDVSELRRSQEHIRFIAEAGIVLASSLDAVHPLRQVADMAVPVIADLCLIHVAESDGSMGRIAVGATAEAKTILGAPVRFSLTSPQTKSGVMTALETGDPILVPDVASADLKSILGDFERETLTHPDGVRSVIIVPLIARGTVTGTLTMALVDSGRRYGGPDLGIARDFATRIALSIENGRLYQEARRAIEARQDLLSFVSHDLRSPLMGILLSTEAMLKSAPAHERRASWKALDRIRRAILQMRHMIDDLLDVSALQSGHLSVTFGEYDATDLLEEAREMLGPLAADKGLTLEVDPPADPCRVRCDRERILQVFSNLVGNAIKFTPEGGRIRIFAERSGGGVRIVIRDTGPGIPRDVLPHLFDRYWQADRGGRKGMGLGLYIAKGIVESQGGTIWAEGTGPTGASFCFTLPLVPAPGMDRFIETTTPRRGPLGRDPIVRSG